MIIHKVKGKKITQKSEKQLTQKIIIINFTRQKDILLRLSEYCLNIQ